MFETAELGRTIDKETFEERAAELRPKLLRVQDELKASSVPVVILVNGVDGAGKGETVNLLHEWLDARWLSTHVFQEKVESERERPDYWRFWMSLPPRGRIGVYFGSWYTDPILARVHDRIDDPALDRALHRVNAFERELAEDGALIIKFWLHLSKKQQKKRLKRLEKDRRTRWRVTKRDWNHHGLYDQFRRVCERTLRETSSGDAPWIVVEGADERYRSLTVTSHIHDRLRHCLDEAAEDAKRGPRKTKARPRVKNPVTILDTLDLERSVSKKVYRKRLPELQGRLNLLSRRMSSKKRGAIAVLQGWDAGGKGGAIRRTIAALDARSYRVIPVGAPTDEEKAHHYLWRFWRQLPRRGKLTIYDRSWYGRVLVERVEGFATEKEWMRAYAEINDFEEQLVEAGIVLIKFWIHISKDEQLRRFKERENTPWKRHKITEEDWRNREKWSDYEDAANEMIGRTSTEYAPWTLVEGNDKPHARLKVLETFCETFEAAVGAPKRR